MTRMMRRHLRKNICVCRDCHPEPDTHRAREAVEVRGEVRLGSSDYQWWRHNDPAIPEPGDPWYDVWERSHYPWGESLDDDLLPSWVDEWDNPNDAVYDKEH